VVVVRLGRAKVRLPGRVPPVGFNLGPAVFAVWRWWLVGFMCCVCLNIGHMQVTRVRRQVAQHETVLPRSVVAIAVAIDVAIAVAIDKIRVFYAFESQGHAGNAFAAT